MPDKEFEDFWESTGGKPGVYRNYCYQGWRAGIEHANEKFTSTNTTQAKMPTLEECQKEVQSRIWGGSFVGTSTNITEVVYNFICRHIGCA